MKGPLETFLYMPVVLDSIFSKRPVSAQTPLERTNPLFPGAGLSVTGYSCHRWLESRQ